MTPIAINNQTTYLNYAPAADRNKDAIWQVLKQYMPDHQRVLEVASGSGQHALYFTELNRSLHWQCTEMPSNRNALQINLNQLSAVEFPKALTLDLLEPLMKNEVIDSAPYDVMFSANSLHIMSWEGCLSFVDLASKALNSGGLCCIYGPFIFTDRETVESNRAFDAALRARDPRSGLRHYDDLKNAFESLDFTTCEDFEMPANNRLLVFKKS